MFGVGEVMVIIERNQGWLLREKPRSGQSKLQMRGLAGGEHEEGSRGSDKAEETSFEAREPQTGSIILLSKKTRQIKHTRNSFLLFQVEDFLFIPFCLKTSFPLSPHPPFPTMSGSLEKSLFNLKASSAPAPPHKPLLPPLKRSPYILIHLFFFL